MTEVRNIDELLEEIVTLPTLPASVERVVHLVNDPECSLADVGKAISADPSLALKTLRLVNSAYYGVRHEILSVDHAVAMLGMRVIKNLALTATVLSTFKNGEDQLLRHSVACGMALRALVELKGPACTVDPEEAFVYGLLHDVGKIVFEAYLPEQFQQAARQCRERCIPMSEAEHAVIGADHAEMGERLAQNWKLPTPLVQAIAGHHCPSRCGESNARTPAALLAVADYICYASGIPSHAGCTTDAPAEVWDAAGLKSEQAPVVLKTFFDALAGMDELLTLAS